MLNLKPLSMLVALGTVGMLTAPAADACVWALGSTAAPNTMLGASFTQAGAASPGTTCGSSLTLTANGVNTGVGPNPPQLFNKQQGAGEMGIGLTNDPIVGENEVTPNSSIIIDVSKVIGGTTMALSVDAGSVQSPDMWELLGSAGEVLVPATSSTGEVMFTTTDTLLTFTATVGNVLLASFDSPEQGTPSIPEPASLALLGTALVGLGLVRRRRG